MSRRFSLRVPVLVALASWAVVLPVAAQEGFSRAGLQAWALVVQGQYEDAAEFSERFSEFRLGDPQVAVAWLDALMTLGRYEEAAALAGRAAEAFEGYIPVQVRAIAVLRETGHAEQSAAHLEVLDALAKEANPKTLDAVELVALGRAALLLGAEPKLVLERFYQPARKLEEEGWQATVATAELAIAKGDYALASRVLTEARTRVGPLPDLLYLQALAQSPSDREAAGRFLDEALQGNPRHLPALRLQARHAIDFEDYEDARGLLAKVRETNPRDPLAWTFEAAIARLLDQRERSEEARARALEPWPGNPEVDYWIGRKLAERRRFAEGVAFLRQALERDPRHLPTRKALGQNLLRLGEEEAGWALVREVAEADPYDVEIYNLMLLHDELQDFETLASERFAVRMRPDEAAVYGARVLELLEQADRELGDRYGYRPDARVVVDFFPDQQDFAVRTLGMPGGLGILGACFGNVISMNSPGSPGAMGSNWESTLWHEYCHTITLGATDGRIPRWLTEGISVLEERRRDPSAAGRMSPEYRARILEAGTIPIGELSAALTNFAEPEVIGFAYFQASLLVEFLIDRHGEAAFQQVLRDLRGNGVVEEVLARRMAKVAKLDTGFAAFARERAGKLAPRVDWSVPEPGDPAWRDPRALAEFLTRHPDNFWALTLRGEQLLAEGDGEGARETARHLVALFPEFGGASNGYSILARAARRLDDTPAEREALRAWLERDAEALDAGLRLLDLDLDAEDHEAAALSAGRVLAVNPLLRAPHRALGRIAEEAGEDATAIRCYETLLALDPVNPADVHYRLAGLYRERDQAVAKRHVLLALEEAPRFRAAHGLLRELAPENEEVGP